MSTFATETELAAAFHLERQLLQTRIERLEAVLREHGISPPGDDPRLGASDGEHLAACQAVVVSAYHFLDNLEELRRMVGSGMELLQKKDWKR